MLDVFIQIKIQETSENTSSLSFISKEKLLEFAKLQSLQGEPCKCNEKAKEPQWQVSAFTAIKKNFSLLQLIYEAFCAWSDLYFLNAGRTGSIVYSSVKLIKIKELFLASLTQGKLSRNSQFHGSMASENEIKGN